MGVDISLMLCEWAIISFYSLGSIYRNGVISDCVLYRKLYNSFQPNFIQAVVYRNHV